MYQARQQENGVDCGVYVIKFVHQILGTTMTSTAEDLDNSFASFFSEFKFTEAHADDARRDFAAEINSLTVAYAKFKEIEKIAKRRDDKISVEDNEQIEDEKKLGTPKMHLSKNASDGGNIITEKETDSAEKIDDAMVHPLECSANDEDFIGSCSIQSDHRLHDIPVTYRNENTPPDSRKLKQRLKLF